MEYNLDSIKLLSSKMSEHKFLLTYKGNISHDIIMAVLALAEKKMEIDGTIRSVKKKVFNVLIECLQNISYHAEVHNNSRDGLIMIGKNDTEFVIYSSNLVSNDNIWLLKEKIDTVNKATREELNQMYIDKITDEPWNANGTAGLGLIDIVKKSGNKLNYVFAPRDENNSYFVMSTTINTPA